MKRLIIPFPWFILAALVVAVSCGMTDCRYENETVWQGNCSPGSVYVDSVGKTGLHLSCPGFKRSSPYSSSGYLVSRMAKRDIPQVFWCKVARSGNSSCVLPKAQ